MVSGENRHRVAGSTSGPSPRVPRNVWVACDGSSGKGSVAELGARTGGSSGLSPARRFDSRLLMRLPSTEATSGWSSNPLVDGTSNGGVTELDASTGKLVRVISAPSLRSGADAIASDATHIWVANIQGSVTELSARTGKVIAVLSGSEYQFSGPSAIATDGHHVWVANSLGQSVTEFPA